MNKTDGYTRLLIELLEGMFKELYPNDPEVINNLGGWDKILTPPKQIKNNSDMKNEVKPRNKRN